MKIKTWLLSILALATIHLFAAPGDIRISRKNESDTWVDVIIPASPGSLIGFNGSGVPGVVTSVASFTATDFTVTNPFSLGTPASGNLTNCTAATQPAGDNSTKLATTAYVAQAMAAGSSIPGMLSLWPTATIGSLPAGWQSCDGTNGTPNMTAMQGANFVTPLNPIGSAPTFSPAPGTYATTQNVTITGTSGYTIRYTTDGSSPSRSVGTVYSAPISVSASQAVKAVEYKDPSLLSPIGSADYIIGSTPTLSSATINASGTQLTLNLSTGCTTGSGGNDGLTISASGGASTATYASGSGSTAYVFNLSRTITSGETITASYTQPGNGIEATTGGIDLATFSGQSVTNNSTVVSPTYLVQQDFEGTGYDHSETWTPNLTPDPDYVTAPAPLEGSQSLMLNSLAEEIFHDFTAQDDVWVFFEYRPAALTASQRFFEIRDSGDLYVTRLSLNADGSVTALNYATTGTSSAGLVSTSAINYIWIHYVKGTGDNSTTDVYISSTLTRGAAKISITGAGSTHQASRVAPVIFDSTVQIYDKIRVDDVEIGDNPQ